MQETNNITARIDVELNNSASWYHCIRIFINLQQVENETNGNFKLRWDNIDETMYMARGENILRSAQLVKLSGYQASSKENQVRIDEMKAICFLLSTNPKRYSLLLRQLRDGDNVGKD